ncbi:MAG: NAD-dependent epimerase/dehydratase family protein [Parvibaculum sp.]
MTPDSAQKRFLVLGAGGFIGLNLARRLAAAGQSVTGYGHPPRFPGALEGVNWIEGDLADTARIEKTLPEIDCVIHLASSSTPATSDRDPIADIDENLISTVKLLQAMVNAGTRRIVFLSSGGTIYGVPEIVPTPETAPTDPSCAYGIVKLAIEKYIRLFHKRHGLEYASLRVSNPFGPYQTVTRQQGVVASFISKAIAGEVIEIWGDGSAERDFLFIDDLVEAICAAAGHPAPAHTLNIGSGEGRKISDVLRAVEAIHGHPINAVFRPEQPAGVPASILDIAKARDVLGWQPKVKWEAGLEQTYSWALRETNSR